MGRAYAVELARRGAVLALADLDADGLARTVAQLPPASVGLSEVYDVSDREATYAFAERVLVELGGAHVIINNAGIEGGVKPVWATDERLYEKVMAVNFGGVRHGTRAFLPQILRRREGAVVNVSSIFGLVGTPNHSDYCASKFAVRGFTESLAAELTGSPVTVHLVHPGGVDTNITRLEASQAFKHKYFGTQPHEIASVVADGVLKGRRRIVYGQGAAKVRLGSRVLPMRVMAWAVWHDMVGILDRRDYPPR